MQTIESALRQQDEVAHDYYLDGPEFARVEEVVSAIRALSIQFIQDHPRLDKDFLELGAQIARVFVRHGFGNSTGQIWQNIQEKTVRAVQKDRLGRPNPSASRFILSSAILNMAVREVVTSLTREKSTKIYTHLLAERETERATLDWASEELVRIRSEIERSVVINSRPFDTNRISYFRAEIRMVDAILASARVSPYLEVASLARDFIASEEFRRKFENERISARLKAHDWDTVFETYEGVTAEDYVMRRDVRGVKRVLKESSDLLNACLVDPAHSNINVFEH
jgi:hypothetical protein